LFCRHFAKVMMMSQIAAFHILMISQYWYSDEYYLKVDESLRSQPAITYKNESAILTSNFIFNLDPIDSNSNVSFSVSKTLNTYRAYGITNSLCKKAINVRLDARPLAIETLNEFLKNFIRQYFMDSNQQSFINTVSNIVSKKIMNQAI
ncbi:2660_t:CDS:1, partial [Racocetra fulgida]